MLTYVRAGTLPARPGALTALAVVGMVYAAAVCLAGSAVVVAFAWLWWVEPPRLRPAPPAPLPPVHLIPYSGDPAAPEGLAVEQRRAVVDVVNSKIHLPRDRAEMLDRLLADVGRRIVPDGVTPDRLILECGRTDGGPDGAGVRANHFFVTPTGRVELSDYSAWFARADGAAVLVRRNLVLDGDSPPRWSAVAIGQTLDRLQADTGGLLSALAAAALLEELRSQRPPAQGESWLIRPHIDEPTIWQGATLSYGSMDGERRVERRWLLADGRSAPVADAPNGVDPLSGIPYVPAPLIQFNYVPGSRSAIGLIAIAGLLEAILAAYLFVGAVLLLHRDPPAGAGRHIWYLCWRVPLLALTGGALGWWLLSLDEYARGDLHRDRVAIAFIAAIAVIGFSMYAAAVLLRRRVRRFLESQGEDPWAPLRQLEAATRSPTGARIIRFVEGAMLALCVIHPYLAFRAGAWSSAAGHLLLFGFSGLIAVLLLLRVSGWRGRVGLAAGAVLALIPGVAAAMVPDPWLAPEYELLARAREPNLDRARDAVRNLAAMRGMGQQTLLILLDGPPPPLGIDGVLDAIGEVWFDQPVRWRQDLFWRALRLSPEWIESVQRAQDARRIAVIEAFGPAEELEPLLRPLLTCSHPVIRRRAANLLLEINPRPMGVIALLRREALVERASLPPGTLAALVNLRPASDATLARLLRYPDRAYRTRTLEALLDAEKSPSGEMLAAATEIADRGDAETAALALRLLAQSPHGRAVLIRHILDGGRRAAAAAAALVEVLPQVEPLLWRLRHARAEELDAIRNATRTVLEVASGPDDVHARAALEALAGDPDEQLSAQALIVLAEREWAKRLGPATYRLVEASVQPRARAADSAPQWVMPQAPDTKRAPTPPPTWLTAALAVLTLGLPLVLLPALLAWIARAAAADSPTAATGPARSHGAPAARF